MLKIYEKPEIQMLCILNEDVVTASDPTSMTNPGQLPDVGGENGEGSTPWDS